MLRLRNGDGLVEERLFALLHEELHARAKLLMRDQPADHTLQATALVNEAWLRLRGIEAHDVTTRGHFVRLATRAMRTILVDHARARATDKRGGRGERVPLDSDIAPRVWPNESVLAIDEALVRMKAADGDLARIAELRIFGGLEHQEIAELLGVSIRTVERAWVAARAWLQRELETPSGNA